MKNPCITVLGSVLLLTTASALQAAGPLNVLFIVADDLNINLGCYGHPVVKSPNIDRLAARGTRFDRAYCNYPVCNPSRTSFMSGRRPDTTGVVDNVTPTRTFLKDTVMLPEHFRKNGYRTLKVGKIYHTGAGWEDPRSWDLDIRENSTSKKPPKEQIVRTPGPSGIVLNAKDEDTWDGFVARKAVTLLEDAAASGKPFFLAAGFRRPHAPYIAPEKYFNLYDPAQLTPRTGPPEHLKNIPPLALTYKFGDRAFPRENPGYTIAGYFASISFMDAQVGLFLDALDRLKLGERTVVVFFSDHGYHLGEHGGLWHKMTLFEESTRVPLIVAAPGKKPGQASARLAELVDVYPTLCDLCGLKPPDGLEGISLVPLLERPDRPWKQAVFTVVSRGKNQKATAQLDPKLMGRTVRGERWRYTLWHDGREELYDHQSDPYEYDNLARDSRHSERAAQRNLLTQGWRTALPLR